MLATRLNCYAQSVILKMLFKSYVFIKFYPKYLWDEYDNFNETSIKP